MMTSQFVYGVDFGGTRTKIGMVNLVSGQILDSCVIETIQSGEKDMINHLRQELEHMSLRHGLMQTEIRGIGVSIGSYVFPDQGVVESMCGFIDIPDRFPLKAKIENMIGLPCRVDNDARLIGLAETRYGAGRPYARVLTLTLGTGVGIGLTINKALPDDSALMHLAGHIKVREIDDGEVECYCGIPGCAESTVSGSALGRVSRSVLQCDNQQLFQLAKSGNNAACEIINRYLAYLLLALNQYVYLYAPDAIVLGGGVANGLDQWLPQVNNGMSARIHHDHTVKVVLAELMENGGIIGAASLFSEHEPEAVQNGYFYKQAE